MSAEEKGRPGIEAGEVDDLPVHVEDRRRWTRGDGGRAEAAEPGPRRPAYVEELEARVKASQARADEVLAAHRRMQQEFDAARARLNRDVEARVQRAKASTFARLLEIADHLDLALANAGAERPAGDPLVDGLRLIHGRLLAVLRDEGLERIEVLGRPFDPQVAEAVAVVEVEEPARHDVVVRETRPGYRLGDLTVRPAQVQVGRHAGAATPPAGKSQEGSGPGR